MRLFNSLGRRLEDFEPTGDEIGIYVCGATVQSRPHVGHGRYAVVFDVLLRYLQWLGHEVRYVRNITDIDDKIIAAAQESGVTIDDVVTGASEAFAAAYDALGVRRPTIEPRATEHIPQMIALVERLIEGGHAYAVDGDVYFAVRTFPDYGKLSGRDVDELRVGARVEPDERKRDPLDFALWKAAKPDEPSWESPWGQGRPGWHIECSAMAAEYLGNGFDIHAGGQDLIFPHHENEIAQSEAATGELFSRVWLHNGLVNLGGEKMSKSTGHLVDLLAATDRYGGTAMRLFYLRTHYRKPIDFTETSARDAMASLDRLWTFRRRVPHPVEAAPSADHLDRFRAVMDDDLDTAGALAVLFEVVREGNGLLDEGEDADTWVATYDELAAVLGVGLPPVHLGDLAGDLAAFAGELGIDPGPTPEADLDAILEHRDTARGDRRFAVADGIRDRLAELGVVVEDSADGVRWHRG